LQRVIEKLSVDNQALSFHLVLPQIHRNLPALKQLSLNSNVFFYENLSDEELLGLYQNCGILLMPMNDSGANTAIVQGIACGIPVVTTNNGGITSYGGNDVYPLVENNDDKAMIELVQNYLNDDALLSSASQKLREFSLAKLDWKQIASEHYLYYQELIKNNR